MKTTILIILLVFTIMSPIAGAVEIWTQISVTEERLAKLEQQIADYAKREQRLRSQVQKLATSGKDADLRNAKTSFEETQLVRASLSKLLRTLGSTLKCDMG